MNLSLMTDPRFGYSYPAGAEEDPNAPWNEEDFDDSEEDSEADDYPLAPWNEDYSEEDWEPDYEDSEADD
jgi:hypothetical protein